MPICVEGDEWNHASGVPGPAGVVSVGDGERAKLRVLCMRVATASESSLDSPSDEDSEPESESSKPIIGEMQRSAKSESTHRQPAVRIGSQRRDCLRSVSP